MGLLKKYLLLIIILFSGCGKVFILSDIRMDTPTVPQFGSSNQRNFVSDLSVSSIPSKSTKLTVNGGFNYNSPIFIGNYLIVNDLSGRIYCFDIYSGKSIGYIKYKGTIHSAPVIYKYFLIYAAVELNDNQSEILFYDMYKGKIEFECQVEGKAINELLLFDDGVLVITAEGLIYKISFDGKIIKSISVSEKIYSIPSADKKFVYFGTQAGNIYSLNINSFDYKIIVKINEPIIGTVNNNELVIAASNNGNITAVQKENMKIIWQNKFKIKLSSLPVIENDKLHLIFSDGNYFNLNLSNGEVNSRKTFYGYFFTTPLLLKNSFILINHNKELLLIDKNDLEILQSINFDGRMKLIPSIYMNKLFIGYENGIIEMYDIE